MAMRRGYYHHLEKDPTLPLRNKLNVVFMVGVVLLVCIYFFVDINIARPLYYTIGFITLIVKSIEVGIRLNPKKKRFQVNNKK